MIRPNPGTVREVLRSLILEQLLLEPLSVLRLQGRLPEGAAQRPVRVLQSDRGSFIEYRLFKAWTPILALLRMVWENSACTGKTPRFKFKLLAP